VKTQPPSLKKKKHWSSPDVRSGLDPATQPGHWPKTATRLGRAARVMRAVQSPVNYNSQHSIKWIILQTGTRRRKGLPGLLELVAWATMSGQRFFFLFCSSLCSVSPQFVPSSSCASLFFFLSLVSLLFVPWSLFAFPGLPRFPLFPGFFFVRLPTVFPSLLVFLCVL
jgi:hypothetical protein